MDLNGLKNDFEIRKKGKYMTNYIEILKQQKEVIQKDITELEKECLELEQTLDDARERKSKANNALRSIEKKLAKL